MKAPSSASLANPAALAAAAATLQGIGSAMTAQNAAASSGAMFNVLRRLGTDADAMFQPVGATPGTRGGRGAGTGARTIEFVDSTLPLGTQVVSYIIRPQRGDRDGQPTDILTVQFGVGAGGGGAGALQVTRSSSAGVKIAA